MIAYDARYLFGMGVMCGFTGSVLPRVMIPAICSGLMSWYLANGNKLGWDHAPVQDIFGHPYAHQIFGVLFGYLMVLRTNIAYQRFWEGITNTETMLSKWTDAIIGAVTFDASSDRKEEGFSDFSKHFVHLGSLLSAVAIQSLHGTDDLTELGTEKSKELSVSGIINMCCPGKTAEKWERRRVRIEVLGGVSEEELATLSKIRGPGRCDAVMTRMVRALTTRQVSGEIKVPAPIVSRIFQEISNGMLAYHQAYKCKKYPFPFAYAQLVAMLLFVFIITCPIVVASFTESSNFCFILTTITTGGFLGLNSVANEIEDPFGMDPNDLPLLDCHNEFNRCLENMINSHYLSSDTFLVAESRPSGYQRMEAKLKEKKARHSVRSTSAPKPEKVGSVGSVSCESAAPWGEMKTASANSNSEAATAIQSRVRGQVDRKLAEKEKSKRESVRHDSRESQRVDSIVFNGA